MSLPGDAPRAHAGRVDDAEVAPPPETGRAGRIPPARPRKGAISTLWDRPVAHLASVEPPAIQPPEAERHRIYALLTLAIGRHYWNGNRFGARGEYPLRPQQLDPHHQPADLYVGGDYHGHNIVAIAVNGLGQVVDFDFNHNNLFNSSVEHAEARLLRRVFALAQLAVAPPELPKPTLASASELIKPLDLPQATYSNMLRPYTIYTSLESCAQCAGTMALAQLGRVVYLQHDPGQNYIGNILYRLAQEEPNGRMIAPLPISGSEFGFKYSGALDEGYARFEEEMGQPDAYFYRKPSGGAVRQDRSITGFLCTDQAMSIFGAAADEFLELAKHPDRLVYGTYQPVGAPEDALFNVGVLDWANRFYHYAIDKGRRGTPHQ